MPKEFIEKRVGNASIVEARRQQAQLSYFTQSFIQKDITSEYYVQWAQRKYRTEDIFLNWVKTVFRTDNFLSFFKYFRFPVSSASLVNDTIRPQLERVFFAEDSFFKYTISGNEVQEPEELDIDEFNIWMFNALLFRHNDILVTDLKGINDPFRSLVSIDNVLAILSHRSIIHKLAYSATVPIVTDGVEELVDGILFMDDKQYIFYDKNLEKILLLVPHDLGECPADYISKDPFSDDDIIRKSIFSYIREQFEEYVFLKTLQRMTDPNGAIPIITKIKAKEKENRDIKGETSKEPFQDQIIGGQTAEFGTEVAGSNSPVQTGTIHNIPKILKEDGSIDMELVKNYITFHFTPTAPLQYIDDRIKDIKANIITTILGDFTEQNQAAKNELQVAGSFFNKQDRLRGVSMELSRIRQRSDFKMLALAHGRDNVTNEAFYGSDFFLETQNELFKLFKESPNVIERKNLLIRLTRNKNRFNPDRADRTVILYELMPYISDADFNTAIAKQAIDPVTFQYQSRFNYWIGIFEAQFGDILIFWNNAKGTDAEKLVLLNNLIINIIEPTIVSQPVLEEGQ